MNKGDFHKVCQKLDSYQDEMIDGQRELVAIPALSPKSGGDGEWKKARRIEKYLRQFGADAIEFVNIEDKDAENGTRPNILARIRGQDQARTTWVMSHMDIVPPGIPRRGAPTPTRSRSRTGNYTAAAWRATTRGWSAASSCCGLSRD